MTAITSLPFVASGPGEYQLTQDFSTTMEGGFAVTLTDDCVFDWNGHNIVNTAGASNSAAAVGAINKTRITVKNGVNVAQGFHSGVTIGNDNGGMGFGHKLLNTSFKGTLGRGAFIRSEGMQIINVKAEDVGGGTYATYTEAFELYGSGILDDVEVVNVFPAVAGAENVAFVVYGGFSLRKCRAYNPVLRDKSIFLFIGENSQVLVDNWTNVNFRRRFFVGAESPPIPANRPTVFQGAGVDINSLDGDAIHGDVVSLDSCFEEQPPAETIEVQLIPTMTAQTTNGVKITGNSAGGGQHDAWHIADGVSTNVHWDGFPSYVEVELPSSVVVTKLGFSARPEAYSQAYAPKSWVIQAWNGTAWQQFSAWNDVPGWSVGEAREFPIESSFSAVSKYRVQFSASQSGSYLQFRNLKMWANAPQ